MRTVDYSEILYGSAALAGLGAGDIGVAELALFRVFHDRRLQQAWEIHRWPELCPVEQRTFRPSWDVAVTYAAGDERYDVASGSYYQSLQAGNVGHAPTVSGVENSAWWALCKTGYTAADWLSGAVYAVGNQVRNAADQQYYQCITAHTAGVSFDGTKFGVLTAFDRYVAWEQPGEEKVGEYLRATDKNPRLTTKLVELPFEVSENGAQFYQMRHVMGWVWLQYRRRRPVLTGDAWDATAVYTSGQQVYFVDGTGRGNFWTANQATAAGESPATAAAKWDVVALPYIFRGYLIQAGYADWLTSDGQGTKASAADGMAREYLELEADKLARQGWQAWRLRMEG